MQQQAEKAGKPAEAYTLLGDLYGQKQRIEKAEEGLLAKAYRQALDLEKKDEMAAREQGYPRLAPGRCVRSSSFRTRRTRKRSGRIRRPRTRGSRLRKEALAAYNPRTDEARAILEPLMKLTPPARAALY